MLDDLKNRCYRILILSNENTFSVDRVFNKQNDRVVTIGTDAFEHRRLTANKHLVSILMLGIATSNVEKTPPVVFEWGNSLTFFV